MYAKRPLKTKILLHIPIFIHCSLYLVYAYIFLADVVPRIESQVIYLFFSYLNRN